MVSELGKHVILNTQTNNLTDTKINHFDHPCTIALLHLNWKKNQLERDIITRHGGTKGSDNQEKSYAHLSNFITFRTQMHI